MPGKIHRLILRVSRCRQPRPLFALLCWTTRRAAPDQDYGGTVAGPIFSRIGEKVARYMNIEPQPEVPASNVIITQREHD